MRASVIGERRTAEELGRAFPGVRVRTSSHGAIADDVGARPEIVIATPGAEPLAMDGYAAAVLLDTGLMQSRPDLRTSEESVRRWFNVIGLVRPAARSGRVCVVGDSAAPALQALVRGDPSGFTDRELAQRRAARLPPAVRMAAIEGPPAELAGLPPASWPAPAQLLGPVAVDDARHRLLVRVSREHGDALATSLRVLQASRSARKATPLRVVLDPFHIG
jgi:primosomal protein N' (replication factor Y)